MLSKTKTLPTEHGFSAGSKLFVYQEVIDRNDGAVRVQEYFDTGNSASHLYRKKGFIIKIADFEKEKTA